MTFIRNIFSSRIASLILRPYRKSLRKIFHGVARRSSGMCSGSRICMRLRQASPEERTFDVLTHCELFVFNRSWDNDANSLTDVGRSDDLHRRRAPHAKCSTLSPIIMINALLELGGERGGKIQRFLMRWHVSRQRMFILEKRSVSMNQIQRKCSHLSLVGSFSPTHESTNRSPLLVIGYQCKESQSDKPHSSDERNGSVRWNVYNNFFLSSSEPSITANQKSMEDKAERR